MKRYLAFSLVALMILTIIPAYGQAQEDEPPPDDNPLLRLLSFVPDMPEFREWLTFGDAAAWHASWGIPRIDSVEALDALDREPRAYWMFIMPRQTAFPDTLGLQTLLSGDYRGAYGFDAFSLDRYMLAGMPPNWMTIAEFSFGDNQIADALTATGYTVEALEGGGALYSIMGDYDVDVSANLPTEGKMGNLNRVALLDGQLILAKATDIVKSALMAQRGEIPSLADDPAYIAAATAVNDPALGDLGELVGAILIDGQTTAEMVESIPLNDADAWQEQLDKEQAAGLALPEYALVNFATRHTEGASYLILAVVFPAGEDAEAAASLLAERLQNYVSLATRQTLEDRWTFEMSAAVEIEELPVALVVMRADDPPPTPADEPRVRTSVFSWIDMVVRRDTLFLLPTAE